MRIRNFVFVTLLACFAPALAAASGPDATVGIPWKGPVALKLTTAQIMERQALRTSEAVETEEMAERDKIVPDFSNLPQAPGAIDSPRWPLAEPGMQSRLSVSAAPPQTAGNQFLGATLSGVHPTFSFPPDGMGTVGPTQFVVFVNGRLVTYNKLNGAADGVLNADPNVFFNSVSGGGGTSDPRIRYDRLSGRWFLVIINVTTPNRFLVACTDAASNGVISGSTVWSFYFFNVDTPPPAIPANCFGDYPTLGIDNNALYIGTNIFCGAPLSFTQSDGFVVNKNSVTSGGPIVVTAFRALCTNIAAGPYTPQGVDNFDLASNEGYFIGIDRLLLGRLDLRRVSDPGGTPSISGNLQILTTATSNPIKVEHLGNTGGTNGQLSCLDSRLFAAAMRNGRLWTAHNIAVTNTGSTVGTRTRDASRWYELQDIVSPGVPSVFQSGTVFFPSATNVLNDQPSFWIPTINVSGQGHAAMGFSMSCSGMFASGAFTGRLATDPLGQMGDPSLYVAGAGSYNPPSDPGSASQGRRWGDYSMTSVDPIDDMTFWTLQEFANTANSYGVQAVQLLAPVPATPSSAPDADYGNPSVVLIVTGTSFSGSGFFDPGPDLPGGVPAFKHLKVQITNFGVTGTPPTLNSWTYIDPTHIQIDINTTMASVSQPGEKYTVRVTNPDGQVAAAAVLRVVSSPLAVDPREAPFALGAVSPNPSVGTTQFEFSLPREAPVRLTIVDLAGREVATLANGTATAGTHHKTWDGRTPHGPVPSGMYYVRYEAGGEVKVRRFAVVR
jgi:hypothetical protein